jgi:hypothetical protein
VLALAFFLCCVLQGRKRSREAEGVSTVSGGIAPAAAAAALAAADAKQQKQAKNFYRFQQRDKRRNGKPLKPSVSHEQQAIELSSLPLHECRPAMPSTPALVHQLFDKHRAGVGHRAGASICAELYLPVCYICTICTICTIFACMLLSTDLLQHCCHCFLLSLHSELMELRQSFDEGRKHLAALKAKRHFKPS